MIINVGTENKQNTVNTQSWAHLLFCTYCTNISFIRHENKIFCIKISQKHIINVKKADFDQPLECGAPKRGSKYTTTRIGMVNAFKLKLKHIYEKCQGGDI